MPITIRSNGAPRLRQPQSYVEEKKEVTKVPKYKCTVCGYIYDLELGDPDGSIKPGTPFEEIPDDWVCPVCGVAKDEFERME